MPILLLVNLKGGVAKTTNAVAIAECFASEGYRTLLIDADHQCMAGEMLLGQSQLLWADHRTRTFYDLLVEMLDEDFYPERIELESEATADSEMVSEKLRFYDC